MQIGPEHSESQLNHLLPFVCKDTAVLLTGGYLGKSGNEAIATNRAKLIGFGRPFITNPDLPERLMNNIPLTSFADSTGFYGGDENMYTTYKTWTESESENYLKELKASL